MKSPCLFTFSKFTNFIFKKAAEGIPIPARGGKRKRAMRRGGGGRCASSQGRVHNRATV